MYPLPSSGLSFTWFAGLSHSASGGHPRSDRWFRHKEEKAAPGRAASGGRNCGFEPTLSLLPGSAVSEHPARALGVPLAGRRGSGCGGVASSSCGRASYGRRVRLFSHRAGVLRRRRQPAAPSSTRAANATLYDGVFSPCRAHTGPCRIAARTASHRSPLRCVVLDGQRRPASLCARTGRRPRRPPHSRRRRSTWS